jgi:RNA polymerase sigma-70 factor (ECF subfamily)
LAEECAQDAFAAALAQLRRIRSSAEAAKSYQRALALITNDSERRFLGRRLREVQLPRDSR